MPLGTGNSSQGTTPGQSHCKASLEGTTSGEDPLSVPPFRKIRTRAHRDAAVEAMKTWCFNIIVSCYTHSSYTEEGFFSDEMIHSLAHDATIASIDDIRAKLVNPPWIFLNRHGEEVLRALRRVDAQFPFKPPVRKTRRSRASHQATASDMENMPPPPDGLEEAVSDDEHLAKNAGQANEVGPDLFAPHIAQDALPTPSRTAIKPRPRTGRTQGGIVGMSNVNWDALSRKEEIDLLDAMFMRRAVRSAAPNLPPSAPVVQSQLTTIPSLSSVTAGYPPVAASYPPMFKPSTSFRP
ncbi:hypothetical protein C8Q80DRAFT_1270086 [Daedaleopsis nitida]|nr:hypothetical protein C8Q80DRAFT_1270086 [Daedaleopsis nitida]